MTKTAAEERRADGPPGRDAPGYDEWCADVLADAARGARAVRHCKDRMYEYGQGGQIEGACALGVLLLAVPGRPRPRPDYWEREPEPYEIEAGVREALDAARGVVGAPGRKWLQRLAKWSDWGEVDAADVAGTFERAAGIARERAAAAGAAAR